ncbi:MAG TPA: UPF0175 family protein [Blastocatellia bacterium]|nr:UPF0175 family protein [Blastocatellia bacterium]
MSITLNIPAEIERQLQAEWGNLSRRALEALAIEGYRSEALSVGQIAEMLNLSILEAESFLKERGVDLLYSDEDLRQDIVANDRVLPG